MNLSYQKIKSIFPHFNAVRLEDREFWIACKTERIMVREEDLLVDGYYERKGRSSVIVLNRTLRGYKWTHTAFHELFHHYLDVPPGKACKTIRFDRAKYQSRIQQINKREMIADALATMAICPMPELERLTMADMIDDAEFFQLVRDRIVVRAEYRK